MKRFLLGVFVSGLAMGCGNGSSTSGTAGSAGSSSGGGGTGAGGTASSGGTSTSSTGTGAMAGAGGTTTSSGGTGGMAGAGGTTSSGGTGGAMGCNLDGKVTPPEQCDDGNMVEGDGCDNDCTFSCVDPTADCPVAPACQQNACLADHTCATAADPAQNGTSCGIMKLCKAGVCTPITCGDGVKEGVEECDFGAGNGFNTGCETDCTFSCTKGPDSCPDANACNGVEVCTTVMNGADMGQKCLPGMQLLDCSACLTGVCGSGVCKASMCGDGCVDPQKGEQCEPPGTVMCDANCKTVVVPPCGNGVREGAEQCDDGNKVNLDGCDATCKFEQDLRSNYLLMQFSTDAYCNSNKLGAAISALAQGQVQSDIDQGIAAGTSGFVVKMLGLESLTGADDPMLEVGAMVAAPVPAFNYNGASDLDWWYTVNPAYIDASRNPKDKLPGSFLGNYLNAGPGSMSLPVNFFPSGVTVLRLSSVKTQVLLGQSFAPTMAAGGVSPGHLPSEHLDPALISFGTLGQPSFTFAGRLCGNASAKNFSQTPVPSELQPGNMFACLEGYTGINTFLDLLVTGCTVALGGGTQVILPSQPDTADPAAPVAGAGAPYTFTKNAQKVVTGCNDKNNAAVSLAACLDAAAYSAYFKYVLGRVILK